MSIRDELRASPTFRPAKKAVTSRRHINVTVTPAQYTTLESIASRPGISLRDLARQCIQFAVDHIKAGEA